MKKQKSDWQKFQQSKYPVDGNIPIMTYREKAKNYKV
jgi:hypothetical protein